MSSIVAIAVGFALLAFFVFLICKMHIFGILGLKRKWLLALFATKIIAAYTLLFVYQFYYNDTVNSDVFKFSNAANVLYSALQENPTDYIELITGINDNDPHIIEYYKRADVWRLNQEITPVVDNRLLVRFLAIINLVTHGNIYLNFLVCAFIAFVGSYCLTLAFKKFANGNTVLPLIAAFFIPSLAFWSSGIMKECLLMFVLGVLLYAVSVLIDKISIKMLILAFLALVALFFVKFYIFVAILPGLIILCLPNKLNNISILVIFASILTASVIIFFQSKNIFGLDFVQSIVNKQNDFINLITYIEYDAGSNIELERLEPTFSSFAQGLIPAYINTLFRPYITEANSLTKLVAFIENFAFFTCFVFMCLDFKMPSRRQFKFIIFTVSFLIILYALIGLTTPNLGAIERYKMPVLPFILLSMFICCRFTFANKMLNRMKTIFPCKSKH